MLKDDCYYLGYFSKTVGSKGELSLKLDVDYHQEYTVLKSLMISINERDQTLVPFFIEHSQLQGKNQLRVKLKLVDDGIAAKKLVGKTIYLPLSFLPKLEGNNFYFHEVMNYEVIDTISGPIGKIKDILDYPAQQLFEIEFDDRESL